MFLDLKPYITYRKTLPKNSNNENLHDNYPALTMHSTSTCTASEMDAENIEGLRGMVVGYSPCELDGGFLQAAENVFCVAAGECASGSVSPTAMVATTPPAPARAAA